LPQNAFKSQKLQETSPMQVRIERSNLAKGACHAFAIVATILCVSASGWAGETVLHSFPGGANGSAPVGILALDSAGNLYGATNQGGLNGACSGESCGIVYELSPASGGGWTETVLYSFMGSTDGGNPNSGVILDSAGNLYGTTLWGGDTDCSSVGCGTVYELVRGSGGSWTEKILYEFTGESDGGNPIGGLVFDSAGNLYGTTSAWGDLGGCENNGCGAVFELSPASGGTWTETTLHTFSHLVGDGNAPAASLAIDAHGNLYGTTPLGGLFPNYCPEGCGTLFELMPAAGGSFHYGVIYQFGATATDGQNSAGGVILVEGKIYGTTANGGSASSGTVWELSGSSRGWTETILHSFLSGTDGHSPTSTLVFGPRAIYGTTENGGNTSTACSGGCGTIFRLAPSGSTWTEAPFFRFSGANGSKPNTSGLIEDAAGNLYGITSLGGSSKDGVVFEFAH
jgi:uncharacterized repeat protein (TIGR03803 family)